MRNECCVSAFGQEHTVFETRTRAEARDYILDSKDRPGANQKKVDIAISA